MSTNEITAKIRELRELEAMKEELDREIEMYKDLIKLQMGDTEELRAGEYRVTWKAVTSQRIDTAALKKALPEIAERFTKSTTVRRFLIA